MLLWVLFAFTKQMFLNIYVMKKMQAFEKFSKNNFLFSIWVFFYKHSRLTRQLEKEEAIFITSL